MKKTNTRKSFLNLNIDLSFKMKLLTFLLAFTFMQFSANNTYSQDGKFNLDLKNVSIKNALKEVQQISDFKFLYNRKDLDLNNKITLIVKDANIETVLKKMFDNTSINFEIFKKQIILKKVVATKKITVEQEAFDLDVKGTIIDKAGNPLPGATVQVKGTTNGTQTDFDGKFSITTSQDEVTLVIQFLGFKKTEVKVTSSQKNLVITLIEDATALDEIVVVGYGTLKKSDLTGSVSTVKSEELTAYPATDPAQALQGRAAGVQIVANNGAPGSDYKVRVRGGTSINASSEPLFVVDGLVGGILPPPEDIASLEVLKDASATSIYGSRGSNGVILITTKKGFSGKTRINVSSSYSTQEVINTLDMLNAAQFTQYVQDAGANFSRYLGSNGETYDTNWQDKAFRTGFIKNNSINISGGSDKIKYYVSGVLFEQEGIIKNSGFERYSLTSNINVEATEKLDVGVNIFRRRSNTTGVRTQEASGGLFNTGIISSALLMEPDKPVFDENGNYVRGNLDILVDNPVSQLDNNINEMQEDRSQINLFADYEIFENLKFKTTFGFTNTRSTTGDFNNTNTLIGAPVGGRASLGNSSSTTIINENYLSYTKEIGAHKLNVLGGYSYQKTTNESSFSVGQGFVSNSLSYRNLGAASDLVAIGSGIQESEIASWYGRLNYSLDDKYLVQINGRYDGASNFAANQKWAFFPSIALGWNMKNEDFLKDVSAISNLKLRASYGKTGNQAIQPYSSLARVLSGGRALNIQNNQLVNALLPQTFENENLTWETTIQSNIGVDVSFLNNRIKFSADYYRMVTKDLLFNLPLDRIVGYIDLFYTTNLGEVENKGFEMTLSTVNFDNDFKWTTDFNLSANRNKILKLPEGLPIYYDEAPTNMKLGQTLVHQEGSPVGSFWGFVYNGVLQNDTTLTGDGFETTAGGESFVDNNGRDANGNLTGTPDGVLNGDDRTIIGDPNPDFIWGMNNTFSYKGFDLNVFFQASVGNDIYNFTRLQTDLGAGNSNATTALLDRWTPSNTNGSVPRANELRNTRSSSRWVEDGSYVRMKNISLGYNLPTKLTEKMKISSLRVYVSGQNLLTFTNYSGFDPEVSWAGASGNSANQGLDYVSYPNAKGITLGLNLGL